MPSPEICPRETASWMYLSSFPAKLGLLNGIFKLIIYKLYIIVEYQNLHQNIFFQVEKNLY
jgi:hypothetical protein